MIALPPRPDLDLSELVRTIPDFPKPGIQFRDITTLIGDAAGFSESVRRLAGRAARYRPDLIVAVEAATGVPATSSVARTSVSAVERVCAAGAGTDVRRRLGAAVPGMEKISGRVEPVRRHGRDR